MARGLPIVGRVVERDALSAAYARVLGGQSQLLLVTGPAGIGKSCLVDDLCAGAAGAAGARVLTGGSAPLTGAMLAYGPFVAALRDHAGWLLEDDNSGDMLTRWHRLFVRVLQALADLAVQVPLLLVLEDLQWADESSRELLGFLAVRLRAEPIMVVATMRDGELGGTARQWLTELERRPAVMRLRLTPLAPAEIAEVVADLIPAQAGAGATARVVSAAEGNPLYARALASAGPDLMPASIADAVLDAALGAAHDGEGRRQQHRGRHRAGRGRPGVADRQRARGLADHGNRRGLARHGHRHVRVRVPRQQRKDDDPERQAVRRRAASALPTARVIH